MPENRRKFALYCVKNARNPQRIPALFSLSNTNYRHFQVPCSFEAVTFTTMNIQRCAGKGKKTLKTTTSLGGVALETSPLIEYNAEERKCLREIKDPLAGFSHFF